MSICIGTYSLTSIIPGMGMRSPIPMSILPRFGLMSWNSGDDCNVPCLDIKCQISRRQPLTLSNEESGMLDRENMSRVRQAIQDVRAHLVREYGKERGYYHFGDCAPGIVSEILSGKSSEEIIARVDRLIAEYSEREGNRSVVNGDDLGSQPAPDLAGPTKHRVRLLSEGKLAGGLTVPAGVVCSVVKRHDEKDFYSNGRATLDVVKDDAFEFSVFEDEVEYLEGAEH